MQLFVIATNCRHLYFNPLDHNSFTMETELEFSSDDESLDGEQIVVQGFRLSRNRTNYRYRGTAMTTTDSMDIDELRLEVAYFETALSYITSAFATAAIIAKSRSDQNLPIQRAKDTMNYICVAVAWISSHIEGLYLDIEDRLYYVHTIRPYTAQQYRQIDDLVDNNQSESLFGFKTYELEILKLHWRIPDMFTEANNRFTGEEAMLIFLFHIRHATPFTQMAEHTFGGDPRLFTHYIRAILRHLYSNFYHKISGDSLRMWVQQIDQFRDAIWNKIQQGVVNERDRRGGEVDWEILLPAESFRIFGWLDDTDMATNRPRPSRQTNGFDIELSDTQQAFYK